MTTTNKPNTAFWIIAVIALLWNIIGVYFWAMEHFLMTEEMRAAYSPAELELMNNTPSWGIYVYGIAVFCGLLASILLLARKKMAIALFGISLLAVMVQMIYWIFGMDAVGVMGAEAIVMPLIVIAIAIFLYFYSKGAARNGWLN
jgi:type IV secretory pathway TrbD component